jgi:hypothetical protein
MAVTAMAINQKSMGPEMLDAGMRQEKRAISQIRRKTTKTRKVEADALPQARLTP